jgi:ribosomal protein L11 methyltransferase
VPEAGAEAARAAMIELFPEGFEEVELPGAVELAAYADGVREAQLRLVFVEARSEPVETGWEGRWREFHRPVRIGPLWVGPPWLEPPADAVAVVVDPGRAFGTGAHPTTRLCLGYLLALPPGGLLDVGCGSGVLAIAAAKLGFDPVAAIDIDPAAVDATRANAEANGVRVHAELADGRFRFLEADTVVANISLEAIDALAGQLVCEHLVTSGYLEVEKPQIPGYRQVERRRAEGWAADLHQRKTE